MHNTYNIHDAFAFNERDRSSPSQRRAEDEMQTHSPQSRRLVGAM